MLATEKQLVRDAIAAALAPFQLEAAKFAGRLRQAAERKRAEDRLRLAEQHSGPVVVGKLDGTRTEYASGAALGRAARMVTKSLDGRSSPNLLEQVLAGEAFVRRRPQVHKSLGPW